MGIEFSGITSIGNKRQVNEDSFWPKTNQHDHQADDPYGMLFIVADGMGGHGAGDIASRLAVQEISMAYYAPGEKTANIGERLTRAIQHAHQQIREKAAQMPELENMGTTVAAAVVKYDEILEQGEAWVAWAGDSRVYMLRQARLKQLTRDHSKVWPLIEARQITWDQLHFHPERSHVTNVLTARRLTVTPEVERYELEPGDLLLLCSDGLSGEVRPEELEHALATYPSGQALSWLIDTANRPKQLDKDGQKISVEGGNDNITALLIGIPNGHPSTAMPPPTPATQAAPAGPPRLGWIIGGALIALVLLGAGLGLAYFGLASSDNRPGPTLVAASTTESTATEQSRVESSSTGVSVAVLDKPTATNTPEPVATQEVTSSPEVRTPTVTRGPINTPTAPPPSPTPTQLPTATKPPLITPTQVITVAALTDAPPPLLIEPKPYPQDPTQHDAREVTFIWEWPGELDDQHSFEILVWLEGENPQGAYDAKEFRQNPTFLNLGEHQYAVTLELTGSPSVISTSPNYLWSVAVVQIEPEYQWLGIESEPRPINIRVTNPDGG